jgi:hypothetical protein
MKLLGVAFLQLFVISRLLVNVFSVSCIDGDVKVWIGVLKKNYVPIGYKSENITFHKRHFLVKI